MKKLVAALAALVMAFVIAGCSSSSAEPKAKPTEGASSAEWAQDGDRAIATYHLADNFSDDLIRTSAQSDTIDLLKEGMADYPDAKSIAISGWFPMKDSYGNVEDKEVLNLTYDRDTLDKINFDNIGTDQIWDLASEAKIHPAIAG